MSEKIAPVSADKIETLARCPLCGAQDVLEAPVQPEPPFKLQRCESCAGIYLSPRPRSDDMAAVYSDYYEGSREKSPRQERRAKKHLRRLMRILPTPGHVLEVGAGDGYFLAAARDAGWKVSGLELSQ